tara:strand:- start:223 stop:1353 length:1131 start_codon:yes stop_codon:yes gene_type:complete
MSLSLACGGDGNSDSQTDVDAGETDVDAGPFALNPEGPPMVRQLFVTEWIPSNGSRAVSSGMAFGQHDDRRFRDDDGEVTQAAVHQVLQKIQVVLDEQLPLFSLDEVGCADDSFSRVPDGTTTSELVLCSSSQPSLADCAVDVCKEAGGILDFNLTGYPDKRRLHNFAPSGETPEYGVAVVCDGVAAELSPVESFYAGGGSQDASLGIQGLGPAIHLRLVKPTVLRSSATCHVRFRPEIVDEDGNAICAPLGGIISEGCEPGDTEKLVFQTEPLFVLSTSPSDGATDALIAGDNLRVNLNTQIDSESIAAVSLRKDGVPVDATVELLENSIGAVRLFSAEPLLPNTEYEFFVDSTLRDVHGAEILAESSTKWTTGD